ncbi:MAG: helix-turn-helix protein [Phycisphaerales bacterium]|nr:helix-turn-helix protein [Phycisphaerales bacterium]
MTRLSEPVRPSIHPLHALAAGSSVGSAGPANGSAPLVAAPPSAPAPASPDGSAPPVPSSVVAARLRWFRTERGLRLEDVAKRAGYTKGFLSKIEHGKASPPVATLLRVAAALGVEADVLFAPDAGVAPDASVHTESGHGVTVRDDTAGPERALLALAANRHHKLMEPFVVTLAAGEQTAERRLTYPGEEFVYVLEGEVAYTVGDETFALKPGDGLYFNATRPHAAASRGGPAKLVRVFCASPARRPRGTE